MKAFFSSNFKRLRYFVLLTYFKRRDYNSREVTPRQQLNIAPAFVANTRPRFRTGHVFLFAEQGNQVGTQNTTGERFTLSIRAVSMERSFFCESRSLVGEGPTGKAKCAR